MIDGVEHNTLETIGADDQPSVAKLGYPTIPPRRLDAFEFDPVGAIKSVTKKRHNLGTVGPFKEFLSDLGYKDFFLRGRGRRLMRIVGADHTVRADDREWIDLLRSDARSGLSP